MQRAAFPSSAIHETAWPAPMFWVVLKDHAVDDSLGQGIDRNILVRQFLSGMTREPKVLRECLLLNDLDNAANLRLLAQCFLQQLMNSPKVAITHDDNDIARTDDLANLPRDGCGIGQIIGLLASIAEVAHYEFGVQTFVFLEKMQPGDLGHEDHIGVVEALGKLFLEDIAARRVGARLEDGDQALLCMAKP